MSQQRLIVSLERTKQQVVHRQSSPNFARSLQGRLHPILQLQRTSGNRRVAQLIQAKRLTPQGKILGLRKLTDDAANGQCDQDTGRAAQPSTAHESTLSMQQASASTMLQRQHVADTGFRYTPPASVTRSIVEIQGIVGTTPDGVYGENTRIAVEKYQTKLTAIGFYSDIVDGKWGSNTEAAHVAFATDPTSERRGYNCAGFAFKDYQFRGLASTKAVYSSMTKLPNCSSPCAPHFHKFWFWEYDLRTVNTVTGASSATHRDFHTVGGQTDRSGNGPNQVMSKNGQRPVEGPKPPLDWKPVTAPTSDRVTGLPVPGFETVRTGHVEECFCNDRLP
jgi:hypothetical protein